MFWALVQVRPLKQSFKQAGCLLSAVKVELEPQNPAKHLAQSAQWLHGQQFALPHL